MIIYIHGFGSHGYGSKAKIFRKYFKSIGEDFIAPSLSYIPALAIQTLEELIDSYHGDVYLIGSSLGGFYATYLSQLHEVKKVVLINPAVTPDSTLKRAVGYAPNFYDESSYEWNEKHLKMLDDYRVDKLSKDKFMVLLQTGDELLEYKDAKEKYKTCKLIVEEGGSHSFDGIERHLENIRTFFTVGEHFRHTSKVKGVRYELYSTQIYKDALAFALKAHGEQKTPQGLPYSFHIVSVANEIINSLSMHSISYDEANIAIMCALLHDVNEDTAMKATRQYVELPHIETIEDGVAALTKDTTLSSKQEQMKDSLERLKNMPKCVQMVKLADRITNLAPAPEFWSKNKRKAYVDEAKFILRELEESNPYLAQKLKNKIENYLVKKAVDSRGFTTVDNYLVFYGNTKALVLDKNHKLYLKTFKAMNRLNEYVKQAYAITLFEKYENKETLQNEKNIVGLEYISTTLNTKNLIDINKHINEKIAKYMSIIYEGEAVICKNFSK